MRLPNVGETWTHFKGGRYNVTGFSFDATGDELRVLVHYIRVDGSVIFSRTIANFLEPVNDCPRFEFSDPKDLPF